MKRILEFNTKGDRSALNGPAFVSSHGLICLYRCESSSELWCRPNKQTPLCWIMWVSVQMNLLRFTFSLNENQPKRGSEPKGECPIEHSAFCVEIINKSNSGNPKIQVRSWSGVSWADV